MHSGRADTRMVAVDDLDHMRAAVFFEGPDVRQRLSRFWTARLRTELEERGVDPSKVSVEFVPARLITFD